MTPKRWKFLLFAANVLIVFAMNLAYLVLFFRNWIRKPWEAGEDIFPDTLIVDRENLSSIASALYPTLYYAANYNDGLFRANWSWWALTLSISMLWSFCLSLLLTKILSDMIFNRMDKHGGKANFNN